MANETIAGVMLKVIEKEEVQRLGSDSYKRCTKYSGGKVKDVYLEGYWEGFKDALSRLDSLIKLQKKAEK